MFNTRVAASLSLASTIFKGVIHGVDGSAIPRL
jgi:hypothetical protein